MLLYVQLCLSNRQIEWTPGHRGHFIQKCINLFNQSIFNQVNGSSSYLFIHADEICNPYRLCLTFKKKPQIIDTITRSQEQLSHAQIIMRNSEYLQDVTYLLQTHYSVRQRRVVDLFFLNIFRNTCCCIFGVRTTTFKVRKPIDYS